MRKFIPSGTPWTRRLLLGVCGLAGLAATSSAWALGVGNLVYHDRDGDGKFGASDRGLAGVTVELWADGGGAPEATTVTDSRGRYLFTGVAAGDYYVHLPAADFDVDGGLLGLTSAPGASTGTADDGTAGSDNGIDGDELVDGISSNVFTLAAGAAPVNGGSETGDNNTSDDAADADTDLTVDFAMRGLPGTMSGWVWEDVDGDGIQDPGETGLPGAVVELYDEYDDFYDTTESDASGRFVFYADPGYYYYTVLDSVDGAVISPADQGGDDLVDSDADDSDLFTAFFELVDGEAIETYDIGYKPNISVIGDFVWEDQNHNGQQDSGEPGLGGVTVTLYLSGVQVDQTTTLGDGSYRFSGMSPGNYTVGFPTAVGGRQLTLANTGSSATNSDASTSTGRTSTISVSAGVANLDIDAGYYQPPARILGTTWYDENGDGIRQSGEGVRSGVAVALYAAGDPIAVDVTASLVDGTYEFPDLGSGPWVVKFAQITGASNEFQLTLANVGSDEAADSDADYTTGQTAEVTLSAGEQRVLDGGYRDVNLGLGNLVYLESNGIAGYQPEEGPEGVVVQVLPEGSSTPVASTTTGPGGIWHVEHLTPGRYVVRIPASEFGSGMPLEGAISRSGEGGDNGADDDADENGIDADYPAVTGVSSGVIQLTTGGEPRSDTTETGVGSSWDDADDGNFDLTVDFVFTPGMKLGNLVYKDTNGNSRFDAGEGVNNVTVKLFFSGSDPLSAPEIASVTTSGGGFYSFTGLSPANYMVYIAPSNFLSGQPLAGLVSMPDDGVDTGLDDDADENGIDVSDPTSQGVRSRNIDLAFGSAPTGADTETGQMASADDASDANGNLTIDFGFRASFVDVGVGNGVWVDADGTGAFLAGEGLADVELSLYNAGDDPTLLKPIARTKTDGSGRYGFYNRVPGSYFIYIAPSEFGPGRPLIDKISRPGNGGDDQKDDDVDENGIDAADPETDGIRSANFTLSPGTEPTESGRFGSDDNASENRVDLTIDFAFVRGAPSTFASWQEQYLNTIDNAPEENSDGDRWSNLLEYAFALPATGSVGPVEPIRLEIAAGTGRVDACVTMREDARDVTVTLELLGDLAASPGGWVPATGITPTQTVNGDGTVTLCYEDLASDPEVAGGRGFVRVSVALDQNLDGAVEFTDYTPVYGWNERVQRTGVTTAAQAFQPAELFSGTLKAKVGGAYFLPDSVGVGDLSDLFTAGKSYYIEITGGTFLGHRFEIDEASTSNAALTLETSNTRNTRSVPSNLTGATIAIREHQTMAGMFPPASFQSSSNPAAADSIMVFSGTSFTTYYLYANGGNPIWVLSSDVSATDRGSRIMVPGEGVFFDRKGSGVTVLDAGVVRPYGMARPLSAGLTLFGTGYPCDCGPAALGMTQAAGFQATANPSTGDAILAWSQDDAAGGGSYYRSYFLLDAGVPYQYWAAKGDAYLVNQNAAPVFLGGRAVFLQLNGAHSSYVQPCPWIP